MRNADMILCGGNDEEGFELIKSIYLSFMEKDVNFYPMSNTAAGDYKRLVLTVSLHTRSVMLT